jgi:hypothetical protein
MFLVGFVEEKRGHNPEMHQFRAGFEERVIESIF